MQGDLSYSAFDSGTKGEAQSVHQALLRAKLVANEQNEHKEDCTEGD